VLSAAPDFLSDTHVHSTFSDGRDTIEENVAQARRRGLHRICLVDHVRTTTTWVGDFVAATQALAATDRGSHEVPLEILRGVETKVLDQKGGLDLPADLGGLDRILVADHQFPMADGPHHPKEVEADRAAGRYRDAELADVLIESVGNSLPAVAGRGILAHMFSVLPKVGMAETDLSPAGLDWLADECLAFDVALEVNERWACPSPSTLAHFMARGVRIVCATDSHRAETIGVYEKVRSIVDEATVLAEGAERQDV
jgi:putative hydrolase